MTAEVLLSWLDGVRQTGIGRWRARCPAHDGKSRDALSVAEGGDGTVLIKCFCTALEIVGAVGLELHGLFPRVEWQTTGTHAAVPRRPRTDWAALIAAVERDLILVKIMLTMVSNGEPINNVDATACQAVATRVYKLTGPRSVTFLRGAVVESNTGKSRSTRYSEIKTGLFVTPVDLSERAGGYPEAEVDAINAARLAGFNDDQIRALVRQLIAARRFAAPNLPDAAVTASTAATSHMRRSSDGGDVAGLTP